MRFHISIRNKIVLLVLGVSLMIYVISIGYIVSNTSEILKDEAYSKVKLSAEKSAFEVRCRFEEYLAMVQSLAESFESFTTMDTAHWEELSLEMMANIYREHRDITAFWDSYEYSQFREGYDKPYGRHARYMYYDIKKELKIVKTELSQDGDPEPYGTFKQVNAPDIWDPYLDVTSENDLNRRMMTTVAAPIRKNARFAGMVGLDVTLNWIQDFIREIKPFEGSISFLLSGNAHIASHPADSMLNRTVTDLFGIVAQNENLEEKLRKGLNTAFIYHDDNNGLDYYVYLTPISVTDAHSNWGMGICVPLNVITHSANESVKVSIFVGLLAVVFLILALFKISSLITRPILQMTGVINNLAHGDLESEFNLRVRSGDELEWMSVAMNKLLNGLRHMNRLAQSIGNGDLSQDIMLLGERDSLGKSLIAMRNSLRVAKAEEEKREIENRNRAWVNQGLAEFSELLRENSNNLDSLCENFLFRIAHFVDAQMGALYLRDDERHQRHQSEEYLMKVSYAWGEKRFLTGKFAIGEGLIGSCAMEKKHILLTEIPKEYSKIVAGVGQAEPKCILIVPLLHEGEAIAVLEIASFQVFPAHVIEFLNNLSVYVAASLFTVQVGMNTQQLLAQSQEQAEELQAQDEELRQNLEELKTTQEEADRKRAENESLFMALSASLFYVEYSLDGYATDVSQNYLERLNLTRAQVLHSYFAEGSQIPNWNKSAYHLFWEDVRAGKSRRLEMTQIVNEKELHLLEFYLPVKDPDGRVYKVMKLSFEV